jgi:predicted DNA-binding protein
MYRKVMFAMRRLKQYGIQLEDQVIARINKLVKKLNQPRSLVMRNLVLGGLKELEFFPQAGIIDAVVFSDNIMSKVKNALLKGVLVLDENDELKIHR